jgi:hypothetical protein
MNVLLDRFPKLRLDPDYPKLEIRGSSIRCPRNLYVRVDWPTSLFDQIFSLDVK